MRLVYLDNAASTCPTPEVLEIMVQVANRQFANPSAAHAAGAAAARSLEQAREDVAAALGAASAEIVFTGGGTEANALGFLGAAARARGRHAVINAIEHPAILRNADRLAKLSGFEITSVAVGPSGLADPDAVAAAVRPDTAVVAVMLVNNELGTLQPVAAIARAVAARGAGRGGARSSASDASGASGAAHPGSPAGPHLHVDAVQAFGVVPFRPSALGVDSLAISGHKIHGPQGTGALWIRPGARIAPLWEGGGQERGMRPGTENLPGIVGFARAAIRATEARENGAVEQMAALRDELERRVLAAIPGARVTVGDAPRAAHISSLSLPGLPAEPLVHALEARGVIASAGSACASKTRGPSHVLKAIGVDDATAVLRFSLSRDTTADEIQLAADALVAAVADVAVNWGARTRGASPRDRI
jgi:cysteine desulfurase